MLRRQVAALRATVARLFAAPAPAGDNVPLPCIARRALAKEMWRAGQPVHGWPRATPAGRPAMASAAAVPIFNRYQTLDDDDSGGEEHELPDLFAEEDSACSATPRSSLA
eukprot:7003196-Alexandrium_andersonii.AAC.1